jgi:hypothetical protein
MFRRGSVVSSVQEINLQETHEDSLEFDKDSWSLLTKEKPAEEEVDVSDYVELSTDGSEVAKTLPLSAEPKTQEEKTSAQDAKVAVDASVSTAQKVESSSLNFTVSTTSDATIVSPDALPAPKKAQPEEVSEVKKASNSFTVSDALPTKMTFMTFNMADFPTRVGFIPLPRFNKYLPAEEIRAPIIADGIEHIAPDVFALQEDWSLDTAKNYKARFKQHGYDSFDSEGRTIVNGGVILFSKFPIIDTKEVVFKNPALNEELYAQKRALCVKLQVSSEYFITVETHHLHAGCPTFSAILGGTSSHRRGDQLGQIVNEAVDTEDDWWHTPPASHSHLKYLKGFAMGDFNMSLNVDEVEVETEMGKEKYWDDRRLLSVSTGMSDNGFHENEIKYGGLDEKGKPTGQYAYFNKFEPTRPENWIDSRAALPDEKGKGKPEIAEVVVVAESENLSTGTDRAELKDFYIPSKTSGALLHVDGKSMQAPKKLIDGFFPTRDGAQRGQVTTRIVSLDGVQAGKDSKEIVPVSDHFALMATWDLTKEYKPRKSIFDNSKPEPFRAVDPSSGCMNNGFCPCCRKKTTRYTLMPSVKVVKPVEKTVTTEPQAEEVRTMIAMLS